MLDETARNPLELYCDFTAVRGSASDELARQAVQRDLEVMRGFMADRLLLRSLHQAMPALARRARKSRAYQCLQLGRHGQTTEGEIRMVTAHASIQMRDIERSCSTEKRQ